MTDTHIKIKPVTPRVQYTGNGSTTVFPYSFPIFDESEMVVYEGDDVITTGYTVSGAGQTDGGNVTFATAPADGTKITLLRNVSIERMTDFQEGGTFRPKNINDELDRQTAFMQQVQEKVDRTLILPPTTDIDPSQILGEVERIYSSIDNVDTVADNIANVNAVAGDLANVDAVAGDLTKIDAVAADLSNIDAVNANKTNIDSVAGNATNINAVAGNQTNIDAVAGNATNINSVAGNATNINAAVANETNINAAVSNETNINTVAGIASDVSTVASNASDTSTVATNMSDVNTCAADIAAIQDAPNQAQAAADSAALAQQYGNDKINQTHITNCITYIPQDIKLELSDGTLTLKSGSKLYFPNGFESDGTTPKFDIVITESDISRSSFVSHTGSCLLFVIYESNNNLSLSTAQVSACTSGTTTPTNGTFYSTTDNTLGYYNGSGVKTDVRTFSIASVTQSTTTVTSIDQTFNGFGYIGSTVFALPGVKWLSPDGRNADGTLKSAEISLDNVLTSTFSDTRSDVDCLHNGGVFYDRPVYVVNSASEIGSATNNFYVIDENKYVFAYNGALTYYQGMSIGKISVSSGKITSFIPKTVFSSLDYNNKSNIAGWGMPSSKYTDITLLASGNTYTAPANGWFLLSKDTNAANQYIELGDSSDSVAGIRIRTYCPASSGRLLLYIPLGKGRKIYVTYNAGGTTNLFKFIYAEGEV